MVGGTITGPKDDHPSRYHRRHRHRDQVGHPLPSEPEPRCRLRAHRLRHEGLLRLHQRPGRRVRAEDHLHHRRRPLQPGGHGGGRAEARGAGQGVRHHQRPRRGDSPRGLEVPGGEGHPRHVSLDRSRQVDQPRGQEPLCRQPRLRHRGHVPRPVHSQELQRQEAGLPPPERPVGRGRREGSAGGSGGQRRADRRRRRRTSQPTPTFPPRRSG